jgi:lysophospholipid acyltransferase (LPLAT)-like uncharacterized protein
MRNPILEQLTGMILGIIYRMWAVTWRYEVEFEDESDRTAFYDLLTIRTPRPGNNAMIGFFHQNEYALIPFFRDCNIHVLISNSKDGQYTATMSEMLGYTPVRGSSTRRAIAGLIESIKKVKQGYDLAIAVDGPRGPIYEVKDGLPAISTKTNTPIFPCKAYPVRRWQFDAAWNKAQIPKLFTKIKIRVGKLAVYNREDLEKKLKAL